MGDYVIYQVKSVTTSDGDDLVGGDDTLFVASTGGIISFGANFNAISSMGDKEAITLEGFVYSSGGAGVAISGALSSLIVDGSATGANAVLLTGAGDRVTVGATGRLSAHGEGLWIEGNSAAPADVHEQIANAGAISGLFGVYSDYAGGSAIANTGTIQGTAAAVLFAGEVGTDYVVNSGTLSGPTAVASLMSANAGVSLTNSGHIVASGVGVTTSTQTLYGALYFDDALGVTDYVANTGDITASVYNAAIYALYDNIVVVNSGKIVGGLAELDGGVANVTNSGTWDTAGYALGLSLGASGSALNNTGAIIGDVSGATGDDAIANSGSISGALTLSGSKNGDKVVNSGSLGAVALGSGAETLLNTTTGAIGDAVSISGFARFTNSGRVGGDVALQSGWTVNNGEIDGAFAFYGSSTAVLVNRGSISQGVVIQSATGATVSNATTGRIGAPPNVSNNQTGGIAVTLSAFDDKLYNAGNIDGDVNLGSSSTFRNSGAIAGNVTQASGMAVNTGAIQGTLTSGDSAINNYGLIGGGVILSANAIFTNSAHGDVAAVEFQAGGLFKNAGAVDGNITFDNKGGTLYNSGQVLGVVSAAGQIFNTGGLNGGVNFYGGGNLTNGARGSIAGITALASGVSQFSVTNAGAISWALLESGSDVVDNSGTIASGLNFASFSYLSAHGHDVVRNGARGVISGGVNFSADDDILTNSGVIDGGISTNTGGDVVTNYGTISGPVLLGGYYADTFVNYRTVNGNVTFGTAHTGTLTNYGVISGALKLIAHQNMTDLGQIQGDVTLGADDVVTLGHGSVFGTINAAANDSIAFAGLTGATAIAGFQASDVLGFNTAVFANFAAVQHAMTQVGSDVRITHDAADWVTLKGVTAASLTASNFAFA